MVVAAWVDVMPITRVRRTVSYDIVARTRPRRQRLLSEEHAMNSFVISDDAIRRFGSDDLADDIRGQVVTTVATLCVDREAQIPRCTVE
jgi:hypothetical protein